MASKANTNSVDRKNIGKTATVIANTAGHNVPLGSSVKIDSCPNANLYSGLWGTYRYNFYPCDLRIEPITKEELENRLKELSQESKICHDKLDFLNEIGSDEYNETEFKVYQVLRELDNKTMSKFDKTKVIAKIIDR